MDLISFYQISCSSIEWIPVTTLAAVAFEFERLDMVFCERVEFGVPLCYAYPIKDAIVEVPVPMLEVRFLTVFEFNDAGSSEHPQDLRARSCGV